MDKALEQHLREKSNMGFTLKKNMTAEETDSTARQVTWEGGLCPEARVRRSPYVISACEAGWT